MNLREYLEEYKYLTLALIDEAKKDGELNSLIEKREDILDLINDSNFNKEEIKTIGNSLKLLKLEDELQNTVKKEAVEVRKQIETLKKARQANKNYNSFENKARVFNKSV